ncbi:MAG: hypothetical protein E7163_03585 [Firmicutes bacterium]|nr:hypothetical protein [Bacillota bacterium]
MNDKWYELDNAAKIFPPTTTYYDPKIFRFSVLLSENVNKLNLEKALNLTLDDFPIFKSVLKKGLFWYYLETSDIKININEEKTSPCEKLSSPLLFEVSYFNNKINLEVYHALSDGSGCITFFRVLIYNYLKINYNIKEKDILNKSSEYEKESDSFKKYYNPKEKIKIPSRKNAYQFRGSWYPEGKIKIISGITSTKRLKELAKINNTTITGFLIAVLIKSIGEEMNYKDKNLPISITVPVDLRNHFESNTVRNFFNVTNINYNFNNSDKLEDIIIEVNKALKNNLTEEAIKSKMNRTIFAENFFLIRLIPLFMKNIVLKHIYKSTRKKQTMGLSNVGIIKMPESVKNYINSIFVFNSTDAKELCICSYEDRISFNFSTHFLNNETEKNFFRLLSLYELDIEIFTNEIYGVDNYE